MHLLIRTFCELADYISFVDRDVLFMMMKTPVISEPIDSGVYHRDLVSILREHGYTDQSKELVFILSDRFRESYDQFLYYLDNPRHVR